MKASRGDNTPSLQKDSPRRAGKLEIGDAVDELELSDLRKLERIAEGYTEYGVLRGEAIDLLNEAIELTLAEKRHWYIDTNPTIFEHLRWLIRTLAYEKRKRLLVKDERTEEWVPRFFNPESNESGVFWENIPNVSVSIEDDYAETQTVKRVYDFFFDDLTIVGILECWVSGYNREQTVKELGITITDYETARRRIKRKESKLRKFLSMDKK